MCDAMDFRYATVADLDLLAEWNHQLLRDEGHRSRLTLTELRDRMEGFLAGGYTAVIFGTDGDALAYALYREYPAEIHLRQLFVRRDGRRQGIGRRAIATLRTRIWPHDKRLTVEVLTSNAGAVAFWRSVGYTDYSLMLEILPDPDGTQ